MTKEHPDLWKHIEIEESKQEEERVTSGLISAAEQHLQRDKPKFLSYLTGTTLFEAVEFLGHFSIGLRSLEKSHFISLLWGISVHDF